MESANYMQPSLLWILPTLLVLSIFLYKKFEKHYTIFIAIGSGFSFVLALIPYGIEAAEGAAHVDFDAIPTLATIIWIFVVISVIPIAFSIIKIFIEAFLKFKNSFNNIFKGNKSSLVLQKESKKVDKAIKRLKQIREMNINASSLKRTHKLCMLVTNIENNSISLFPAIEEKVAFLDESKSIEQSIRELIQKYMNVGDSKKATYYFQFLRSFGKFDNESSIDKECQNLLRQRMEDKAIVRRWIISSLVIIIVLLGICTLSYQKNSPYRNFKEDIKTNSLNVNIIESKYEEYLTTKKGSKVIKQAFLDLQNQQNPKGSIELYVMLKRSLNWGNYEQEDLRTIVCQTIFAQLSEYYNKKDISSALNLLDSAPDYIYDDNKISSTHAHWLADYAVKNNTGRYPDVGWSGDYTAYKVGNYIIAFDAEYEENKELHILNITKSSNWDHSWNAQSEYSELKHIYDYIYERLY